MELRLLEQSPVLNGDVVFKVRTAARFLVMAKSFRIQVGPIKNTQSGATQAMPVTEKPVVTSKSHI